MTDNESPDRAEPKAAKPRDISHAANPDLRASLAALRRAGAMARKVAIDTDTELVVVREGRIVHIPADTLRRDAVAQQDPQQ